MSREIRHDFESLKVFFTEYNLTGFESNIKLVGLISKMHKKYFSILTFTAELKDQSSSKTEPHISADQISFLTETCSDLGNSLFCLVHGAYKPAKLILRSSIETFLKAFCQDEIPDISKEKSVYSLFDKVKLLFFF